MKCQGKFTGSKRSAFPFTLASQAGQIIYSVDSVPQNFTLSDPDHLNAFQIDSLYHHWLKRQKKKLAPFIVLNPSPNHTAVSKKSEKAKGKEKKEYVDVSTEDEGGLDEDGNTEKGEILLPQFRSTWVMRMLLKFPWSTMTTVTKWLSVQRLGRRLGCRLGARRSPLRPTTINIPPRLLDLPNYNCPKSQRQG